MTKNRRRILACLTLFVKVASENWKDLAKALDEIDALRFHYLGNTRPAGTLIHSRQFELYFSKFNFPSFTK